MTLQKTGIRLEFLDIELSKEEQISFFAKRDETILGKLEKLEILMKDYSSFKKSVELDSDSDIFKERSEEEILSAMDEFTDKLWYDRH